MLFCVMFRLISKYLNEPFLITLGKVWVSVFTLWLTMNIKSLEFPLYLPEGKSFNLVPCIAGLEVLCPKSDTETLV